MYTKDNIFAKHSRINSFQLSKLHTFEVAARHNSFSLAADELSLTPSAISHRINKLEEEIGIKLFERTHRKVVLTEEGQRIYHSLQKTLNNLNQEIIDIKNGETSGLLTIYSRPSFAQCWLVPRIHAFKELYPSIDLKLLTGNARFQIISATFMDRCRRGSQLLKVVRSSRQRNKQYYHELSAVD
ncbi:LysR family transcriptional regulator, partial [Vibrio cholerae]|uniref:LysR family transcriptional regulator n=1 Tax=Vibrio cholerae TaxID=666 RepID=UPI0030809C99